MNRPFASAQKEPRAHVAFLTKELGRRKARNPRYSLRAFARFLEMEPSALSRVIACKQELSLRAARRTTELLQMSPPERQSFLSSVAEELQKRVTDYLRLPERAAESGTAPLITVRACLDPAKLGEAVEIMKAFAATLEDVCGGPGEGSAFEFVLRRGDDGGSAESL